MKLPLRTAVLAIAALLLLMWNVRRATHSKYSVACLLLAPHLFVAGDLQPDWYQRQVIVTKRDPESVRISQVQTDEAGLQRDFALIYGTRNQRLAWLNGERKILYGEAIKVMGDMYQSSFHPAIALLTPQDATSDTANVAASGLCPFTG